MIIIMIIIGDTIIINRHDQSTQSNELVISLQYSKKEVSDGFHFLRAVYTSRINPLSLKESLVRLLIIAEGFLKLPNLHMLLKQKSLSFPGNWLSGVLVSC